MLKLFVNAWKNLKKHAGFIVILFAILVPTFQLGVKFGEKSAEEKEAIYKNREVLIKQSLEFDKEKQKIEIENLKHQIEYLNNEKAGLKEKLINCDEKYRSQVIKNRQISSNYFKLKEHYSRLIKEKNKIEKILANKRPLLDYKIATSPTNNEVTFIVYNRSDIPLKVIETDYLPWVNGERGNKNPGVESTILYPGKNQIYFSFDIDEMEKVKAGKIDWRGGICLKYTTLNRMDYRYWIYQVWFLYDYKKQQYNVIKVIDNNVSSKKHCNIKQLKPYEWGKQ